MHIYTDSIAQLLDEYEPGSSHGDDGSLLYVEAYRDPDHASRRAAAWVRRAEQLRAFVAANGSLPRAADIAVRPELRSLVNWIGTQRTSHRYCMLNEFQAELLETVPGWSWSLRGDTWRLHLREVGDFIKTHGVEPRERSLNADERRLGEWLRRQRAAARRGTLHPARSQRLAAHQAKWTVGDF